MASHKNKQQRGSGLLHAERDSKNIHNMVGVFLCTVVNVKKTVNMCNGIQWNPSSGGGGGG